MSSPARTNAKNESWRRWQSKPRLESPVKVQSVFCGSMPTPTHKLLPKVRYQITEPLFSGGMAVFRQASALRPSVQTMNSPVYCAIAFCPTKQAVKINSAVAIEKQDCLVMKVCPP